MPVLGTRRDAAVSVSIPGARPTLRPRTVDASRLITSGTISPSGKRVALEARGDIWSAPAKEGVVRNLTRTDGAFERLPSWSPDGRWIAYFSDEQGEYDLYIRPADSKPPAPKDDAKKAGKDGVKEEPKKDEAPDGAEREDDRRSKHQRTTSGRACSFFSIRSTRPSRKWIKVSA